MNGGEKAKTKQTNKPKPWRVRRKKNKTEGVGGTNEYRSKTNESAYVLPKIEEMFELGFGDNWRVVTVLSRIRTKAHLEKKDKRKRGEKQTALTEKKKIPERK